MSAIQLTWTAALALTAVIAFARGGTDERVTALVLMLADIASRLHHHDSHLDLVSPLLDAILLIYLTYQAMRSRRWWPLYACAAQCCTLLSAGAYWMSAEPLARSYFWASGLWSYLILLSLAVGTACEQARVREDRVRRTTP